jgi:hypothetical protein
MRGERQLFWVCICTFSEMDISASSLLGCGHLITKVGDSTMKYGRC